MSKSGGFWFHNISHNIKCSKKLLTLNAYRPAPPEVESKSPQPSTKAGCLTVLGRLTPLCCYDDSSSFYFKAPGLANLVFSAFSSYEIERE